MICSFYPLLSHTVEWCVGYVLPLDLELTVIVQENACLSFLTPSMSHTKQYHIDKGTDINASSACRRPFLGKKHFPPHRD